MGALLFKNSDKVVLRGRHQSWDWQRPLFRLYQHRTHMIIKSLVPCEFR